MIKPNWNFLQAAQSHGTITGPQEVYLIALATQIGRARLLAYRQQLGIFEPIPRLSRQQAAALLSAIVSDQEQVKND